MDDTGATLALEAGVGLGAVTTAFRATGATALLLTGMDLEAATTFLGLLLVLPAGGTGLFFTTGFGADGATFLALLTD